MSLNCTIQCCRVSGLMPTRYGIGCASWYSFATQCQYRLLRSPSILWKAAGLSVSQTLVHYTATRTRKEMLRILFPKLFQQL